MTKDSYHYDSSSPYNEFIPLAEATYFNPNKVSKQEYNIIVDCLKNAKEKNFLPSILIYGKPLKDDKFYDFLHPLPCKDPKYAVNIELNGQVAFYIYLENFDQDKDLYNFYIGYFDSDGKFIRDIEPYKRYTWAQGFRAPNLHEAGFAKAYKDSPVVKLLFNSNGEPINDYLKNCKNSEDKNVFDIFKH